MSLHEQVDQWLDLLRDEGAPPLRLGAEGAVGLRLDNGLTLFVEVEEAAQLLHLHVAVLKLPAGAPRVKVLEAALGQALYGRGTDGATLGLDAAQDALVLSITRGGKDLDGEVFAQLLSALSDVALRLSQAWQALGKDGDVAEAAMEPVAFLDQRMRA